jgi:hypothetical protein
MNLQQVCLTALAFSSARGGAVEFTATPGLRPVVIHPVSERNQTEIYVERDLQDTDSWLVGLRETKPLALRPPLYFPPAVNTQEALLDALTKAWESTLYKPPPPNFLSRFTEA